MNKARLESHREKHRSLAQYIHAKNKKAMQEWVDGNLGIDRKDPDALEELGRSKGERGMKLMAASQVLEGTRRDGALQRAGRFLREEHALFTRAAALRRGESPADEWATCRCGSAFQPGDRGYATCWTCSSAEYYKSSYVCVFCERRHSMSYAACFVCKADGREDSARQLRLVINRRDNYTCALCGADGTRLLETEGPDAEIDPDAPIQGGGVGLQVSRINPEGGIDPWNLETLCLTCQAVRGSKNYDRLDEREFWRMVQVYSAHLFEYLAPDERLRLLALEPDSDGGERVDFGHPVPWPDLGETVEQDGLLNVLASFGTRPTSVTERINVIPTGPDACKGEVVLSAGKRPCRNPADHSAGTLCETSCR